MFYFILLILIFFIHFILIILQLVFFLFLHLFSFLSPFEIILISFFTFNLKRFRDLMLLNFKSLKYSIFIEYLRCFFIILLGFMRLMILISLIAFIFGLSNIYIIRLFKIHLPSLSWASILY